MEKITELRHPLQKASDEADEELAKTDALVERAEALLAKNRKGDDNA